jgi:phage terminase large subunit
LLNLNEKFKSLYTSNTRYYILTGGRGSGKSHAVNLFATHLTFQEKQRILFTRYTMTSARLSIIPEFVDKINLIAGSDYFDIQQTEIVNKLNQSAVLFKGLKTSSGVQTANLKSLQGITTWVLDEAEELTDESEFDKIDLSVRQANSHNRVILILNPSTKNHWIYKRFFESADVVEGFNGVKGDVTYIHTTYLDNIKNLSDSFLKQIESIKINNPIKYNHIVMGGWISVAEGAIFTNWTTGDFDNSLPYVYGQDYGFAIDPTTLIKVAVDKVNKKIYAHEELYEVGKLGTDDIFARNKQLIAKQTDLIIGDSHGQQNRLVEDLRRKGLNIQESNNYCKGASEMIPTASDYQIIITSTSHNLRKEFSNFVWNDKKAGIPVDAFNHGIDGMLYALSFFHQEKKYNKVSKKSLI